MNSKTAKRLRRLAREMKEQNLVLEGPSTQYETRVHAKKKLDYVLNDAGEKVLDFVDVNMNQRRINPKSERGVYRALKMAADKA